MVPKLLGQRKNRKRRKNDGELHDYAENHIYEENGAHMPPSHVELNSSNEMDNYDENNENYNDEIIEDDDIYSENDELLGEDLDATDRDETPQTNHGHIKYDSEHAGNPGTSASLKQDSTYLSTKISLTKK